MATGLRRECEKVNRDEDKAEGDEAIKKMEKIYMRKKKINMVEQRELVSLRG